MRAYKVTADNVHYGNVTSLGYTLDGNPVEYVMARGTKVLVILVHADGAAHGERIVCSPSALDRAGACEGTCEWYVCGF